MAEIYLARAPGLEGFEKLVALKRVLPHLVADERVVGMFLKEARLAATLRHPNIVHVFDIGMAEGSYFFAMEYVEGVDARTLFLQAADRGGIIPLEQALAIVIGVAAGLHHAHEQVGTDGRPLGIVHRDVSPSNLLVSYEGSVKVADFGIAKAAAFGDTRTRSLRGKLAYMSPEQCQSAPLDRRSDVFSLGTVLYELTTGRRLFRDESEFVTMRRIVEEDAPPPSRIALGYPPDLERVVVKALRREPAERFQSAQELQLALEDLVRARRLVVSSVALGAYVHEVVPRRTTSTATAIEATRSATPDEPMRPAARAPAQHRRQRGAWWAAAVAGLGIAVATVLYFFREAPTIPPREPPAKEAPSPSELAQPSPAPAPEEPAPMPPPPAVEEPAAKSVPAESPVEAEPAAARAPGKRRPKHARPRKGSAGEKTVKAKPAAPPPPPPVPAEKPPTEKKPEWDLDSWYTR
jgi:serine/threonine protein kinase